VGNRDEETGLRGVKGDRKIGAEIAKGIDSQEARSKYDRATSGAEI